MNPFSNICEGESGTEFGNISEVVKLGLTEVFDMDVKSELRIQS